MVDDKKTPNTILMIYCRICKIPPARLPSLMKGWRCATLGRTADNSATISSPSVYLKKTKVLISVVRLSVTVVLVSAGASVVTPGSFCREQLAELAQLAGGCRLR